MTTFEFWLIQGPGWLLVLYLVVAQCTAAINYDLGVLMGTQEPAEGITPVGAAFFWGIALADLVFYTPILALGLLGHATDTGWAPAVLGAALGTTVYWPIFCLATVRRARGVPGWSLPKESQYWIVLPVIALWAFIALVLIAT